MRGISDRIKAKKSLGQHFLIDNIAAAKIVEAACLEMGELVIEIGPGTGVLTDLIQRQALVTAIEYDKDLAGKLMTRYAGISGVAVLREDACRVDFDSLSLSRSLRSYKVIANLPYYITTPIIMRLVEDALYWESMVLMMQNEVAERICAIPGSRACGAITYAVQYRAKTEKLFILPPSAFSPRPQVQSAVVRFTRLAQTAVQPISEQVFFKTITAAFKYRRKTLLNSVTSGGLGDKETWLRLLDLCQIDGTRRGETLSMEEYCRLSDAFCRETEV